jgi:hypothetical protein
MAQSHEYLHESACGLQEEDHRIADEFVEVIEEVEAQCTKFGYTFDWGAAGCGSCFHTAADAAVYWVAQNDAMDDVALNFDVTSDALSRKRFGVLIVDTAEAMDVPVSWNGDTRSSVVLGTDKAYYNFDPGARVERRRRTGTVVNPDTVNSGMDYVLYDQDVCGERLGHFPDRESAKRFARNTVGLDEYTVRRTNSWASRDGTNIVQWDGESKPTIVNSKSITDT